MSYVKEKLTVEEYYEDELPRALRRHQRALQLTDGKFADYLGIGVDNLRKYYNEGTLPGSTTLMKLFSKLGKQFVLEILFTAGIVFEDSTSSGQSKPETGISIVANQRGK